MTRHKIQSTQALARIVRAAQARGKRVVLTNGCFDLLHAGHVTICERAKRLGDLLVVAINSDRSIRALKGPGRPIVRQADRARVVAALESVDYVAVFDEATPERLIATLRPQVLVKGADWRRGHIIGSDLVRRDKGRVVRIPLVAGRSTTDLIRRMRRTRSLDSRRGRSGPRSGFRPTGDREGTAGSARGAP